MKWGAAILGLVVLFSVILVDEWRETSFREDPERESVGKREASGRRSLTSGDQRSVDELVELMVGYEDLWYEAGIDYEDFPARRWEVVHSWSLAEVEAVCREEAGGDWSEALFERWGMEAREEAMSFVLTLQKKYADEYIKAATSLDGGGAVMEAIQMNMNAVLAGWSRLDPHAAWKAVSDPMGLSVEGEIFEDHGYFWNAPIKIFEHLSTKDPDFAIEEFLRHEDPMFQGAMLKGMANGLSSATDWEELMGKVLSTENVEHRDIMAVLRGGLLGRWMAVDAEAAENWFRGDQGISISRTVEETVERQWPDQFEDNYKDAITKVEVTDVSLARAVRHWAANDKDGAIAWLKERSELVPEILGAESWLDPDDLEASDVREILVTCYPAGKREELLRSYLGSEDVFHSPLNRLFVAHNENQLRREVAELAVNDEVEKEIFRSITKVRGLSDEVPEVEATSDPFANE